MATGRTGLTKLEQETIINFNASEKEASVYSTDPVWMKKLEKLGGKQKGLGIEINVPKSWVKVQKPRELSARQKAALEEARKKSPLFNSTES